MADNTEKQIAQISENVLTDENLTEWKKRVGLEFRIGNIFNQTASYEAIRNFSYGIGDSNPLHSDINYATGTNYGALIASPAWTASVFPHWVLQGLPGIHADHSASDWEFIRPIYINDKITPKSYFVGFDVKQSKFAGKTAFEYQRFEYWNQRNELVSRGHCMLVRYERQTAKEMTEKGEGKYDHIKVPHPWTNEELEAIDQEVLAEEIRGSEPRYWEDVQVGDELAKLVKGPFGVTDMIAYTVGAAPVQVAAHGVQLKLYKNHPAWGYRDPVTRAWEPVYSVHYSVAAARGVGAIYAYDAGVQRHSWLVNFLTNWMGDHAWVKKCNAQYRQFVYLSDVIWFKGNVTKKYIDENDEHCVDIETHGINQRDEDTMPGFATVILPSKEKGTSPIDKRLPAKEYRGTGKGVYF
ncbi:MAG: MaoC family dehydratase N-terminal domain-containing protein [Desulfobacteraceae bacterium]|nr:MaoC family dehydratase N-terminal domain-containing protein [Desulfobacteraceae bacterium]